MLKSVWQVDLLLGVEYWNIQEVQMQLHNLSLNQHNLFIIYLLNVLAPISLQSNNSLEVKGE